MSSATRITIAIMGVVAGLAGAEHAIGAMLQGNRPPESIVFLSWPDSEFFSILAGEPAMSIVPNFLVTGILALVVSLGLLLWTALFVQRKGGALVLILLSVALLLVGGGFGPPLLGLILGTAAVGINSPLTWWRRHLSDPLRRVLGATWQWFLVVCVMTWLMLMPGTNILAYYSDWDDPNVVVVLTFSALGLLVLTLLVGLARDSGSRLEQRQTRE